MSDAVSFEILLPAGFRKRKLTGLRAWVAALRSGEYPQGQNCLMAGGKYCCLGVLSQINGRLKDGCDGDRGLSSVYLAYDNPWVEVLKGIGTLPPGVVVRVSASESLEDCTSLAALNDGGLSFAQIADVLETVFVDPEPSAGGVA